MDMSLKTPRGGRNPKTPWILCSAHPANSIDSCLGSTKWPRKSSYKYGNYNSKGRINPSYSFIFCHLHVPDNSICNDLVDVGIPY